MVSVFFYNLIRVSEFVILTCEYNGNLIWILITGYFYEYDEFNWVLCLSIQKKGILVTQFTILLICIWDLALP